MRPAKFGWLLICLAGLILSFSFPITTHAVGLIEGYASATSVNHGESIDLHVSTTAPSYLIEVYRYGWYDGAGQELITTVDDLPGHSYQTPAPDPTTGMVDANWPVSYTLKTTKDWQTGAYFALLKASTREIAYIEFVVRADEEPADILFVVPVTTEQAYNSWGGKSLYDFNSPGGRASKVSFNRPYSDTSQSYLVHYDMIRFLDSKGYNLSYATSLDLQTNLHLLDNKKVFFSNFHDEYWSKEMRENITQALDNGKSLAFFDANNIFWQVRFEPDANGNPNRTMVGYKDAKLDPMASTDPALTTVNWRDVPVSQPENALLGIMWENNWSDWGTSFPLIVTNASHWVYEGTGVTNGTSIPKVIGYEYDKVWDNGMTPPNLEVLSESPVTVNGIDSVSNSSIYQAASGAYVFDAGTMFWSLMVDDNPLYTMGADARLQRMTTNILDRMIASSK